MKSELIQEMKNVFGKDQKRIDHALAVLSFAEQILSEQDADPLVVKAAAILHDIGIHEAERKYNSTAGKYQEIEGPPIAKEILIKYKIDETVIEHICKIIANHHSAKEIDTPEFRILWDADWLVNIPAEFPNVKKEKLRKLISRVFKTRRGRQIAIEIFLKE